MSEIGRGIFFFVSVALVFAVTMMGTTLPTPLYPIYQAQLGFSALMITVIYAIYALGVIVALILTGSWSDQIGRRPVLALGLFFSGLSAAVFIYGGSLSALMVGRLLSGFSAGIFTGTATVAVVELLPPARRELATLVATAANMGGLGCGPLLAGILSEYAPAPLLSCFVIDLILVVLAGLIVYRAPETADRLGKPKLSLRMPEVPAEVRSVFVPAAIAGFAGFSVMGMFAAVAPAFIAEVMGYGNHALAGLVVFVLFVASTVGQILVSRTPRQARLPWGCVGLIIGLALVIFAIKTESLIELFLGGMAAGLGQGLSFRAGMGEIAMASPVTRRAEVASAFFVVAYVAISLPVIGLGLLASVLGLAMAGMVFSALVALLALIALIILLYRQRAASDAVA